MRYIYPENAGVFPFHLPTSCTPEDVSEVLMKVVLVLQSQVFRISFFYLGFLSQITFTNHRTAGEGGGHFFNSLLPLPSALQTLRQWPGDYCWELISAHRGELGTFGFSAHTTSMDLPPSRFFILEKEKLHHFPLKALKGYLKNLKISNVADLLFWKSVIFRKSNLLESNYSN